MRHLFQTEPAYSSTAGVTVTGEAVVISTVFRGQQSCGIILYEIQSGNSVRIPFTDEYRFGSLYSVKVFPIDTGKWCYRLYRGQTSFVDPCCRSIVEISSEGETILAGGFYFEPDDKMPPFKCVCSKKGGDSFIYSLHIKGFTKLDPSIKSCPGTFSAAAEKIPYLVDLGVTAVELMPVYELQPDTRAKNGPLTMEDALALYPVSKKGFPLRDLTKEKTNYWGYGRGFYYAPRAAYSTPGYPGGPQKEFSDMVKRFHEAGIGVYMQLYFPVSVSSQTQAEILRFYVTHYEVDGFHLMGAVSDIRALSSDPLLSDVRLFHTDFPFERIIGTDAENPESGEIGTANLYSCSDRFSDLIRCFVKSDRFVMREFLYELLKVSENHGNVHYVCGTNGFTLRALVSYNEKHNEANGEGGTDGRDENYSWNCGEEGESESEEVLKLRRNQIRNFLTLLFLTRSTPMLKAGDEIFNTQYGNNNPYCQDNEIGWVEWDNGETGDRIHDFVRRILAFRRAHPVFTKQIPFKNIDSLGCGYPDLSLHGSEAWKPDLGENSHSIGICLCEHYAGDYPNTELLYIAINMYWETQELGLPKLSPGRRWNLMIDTALENPFIEGECITDDQRIVEVAPRSIRILNTVTSSKPVRRRKKKTAKSAEPAAPAAESTAPAAESAAPAAESITTEVEVIAEADSASDKGEANEKE